MTERIGVREAARRLGVHENTVRNWTKAGLLTAAYVTRAGYNKYDPEDVERLKPGKPARPPSYHDLFVATSQMVRTRLFNLPYGIWVTCNRVVGWQVWDMNKVQKFDTLPPAQGVLLGGEYDGEQWLVLDVAGKVIVDSRPDQVPCPGCGVVLFDRARCTRPGGCDTEGTPYADPEP